MVLLETCRILARWARDPQLAGLSLAVNIGARQLRQPDSPNACWPPSMKPAPLRSACAWS